MSTNFDTMFAALDAPFTNFKKNDGPIVWQAKDLLVHQDYVLKVPVMPGSTIKYSFTTTIGDICFSTEFVATGQSKEVLVQPLRVPSDIETITGTFKAVREGTFSMIFDNKFSWFNPKLLNYQVFLHQPAFTLADNTRCMQSRRMLHSVVEDIRQSEMRLMQSKDRSKTAHAEVAVLSDRLATLTKELESKAVVLKAAKDEIEEMTIRIYQNLEKRNGICIRCLDKKLITLVLSFLGRGSGAYMTCKYWKVCLDEAIESQKALSSIPALMSAETIPAAEKEEVMTEEDVESAN